MQDSGAPTSVPSLTLMLEISLQIFIASGLDHKHIPQGLIMSISLPLSSSPLLYSLPTHIYPMAGKCSKTQLKLQPSFDFFFF